MPEVHDQIREYSGRLDSTVRPVSADEIVGGGELAETTEGPPHDGHTHPARPAVVGRRMPRLVYALAAAVLVLLAVGVVALLAGGEVGVGPVVPQPTPPTTGATVTTEAPPTTATSPPTTVPSFTTESGVLRLAAQALTERRESPLAGVDVHRDLAFVGGMSVGYYSSQNVGVRLVDLSDPENPELVGRIPLRHDSYFHPNDPHGHGDAVVTSLDTPNFSGDVAIVLDGVPDSYDAADYPEVFGLWDVTEPSDPQFLDGVISLGSSPLGNGGDLGDKPYDSMAVSGHYFFTLYDETARLDPSWAGGDAHMAVVDISNPREPVQVSDWQDDPEVYLIGLSLNEAGTRAYLTGLWPPPEDSTGQPSSHGYLYIVDVENPAVPTLIGTYSFPLRGLPSSISKAVPFAEETHVLLLDHSWARGNEGIVLILDITDLDNIRQVSAFDPQTPAQAPDEGRVYRIATDVVVRGDLAFVSWLRDGVRAIDISDPLDPVEVGHFTSLYRVDSTAGVPFGNDLSDIALLGDRYVVATTVWGPRMYVLEVVGEDETSGEQTRPLP